MNSKKAVGIEISEFSGLNLNLSKNEIQDNELTSCKNFYKKGGCLRVRPGLENVCNKEISNIIDYFPIGDKPIKLFSITPLNSITTSKSEDYEGKFILTANEILFFNGKDYKNITLPSKEEKFSSGVFFLEGKTSQSELTINDTTYKAVSQNVVLLIESGFYRISAELYLNQEEEVSIRFNTVKAEPTVPVILEGCNSIGEGEKVGSHNILTGRCYQKFNTDGVSLKYNLADMDIDLDYVEVIYFDDNLMRHQNVFSSNDTATLTESITMTLNRKIGVLTFSSPLINSKDCNLKNNLVISYSVNNPLLDSLKSCSAASWFNGGSKSKYGNGRLFISGSLEIKNRVFCSEPNDPFYFRDDKFFDVGLQSEKITTLKVFNYSLMIFAENSIYSLSYCEKLTGEDFVVKEINSEIGCPFKLSIQDFLGRLLFASVDGVYEMITSGKLKKVSEKIEPQLKNSLNQSNLYPTAVLHDNYYMLLIGETIFALNCGDFGKSKEDIEQWYVFSYTAKNKALINFDDKIYLICDDNNNTAVFTDNKITDSEQNFNACFETKSFDFGICDFYKKLIKLSLNIKSLFEDEVKFKITLISKNESKEKVVSFNGEENKNFIADILVYIADFSDVSLKIEKMPDCNNNFMVKGIIAKAIKTYPKC